MFEEYTKEELLTQATAEAVHLGEHWYKLGALLERINQKSATVEIFKRRCQDIGLSWRTAYYLIALHRHFVHHDLQPPEGISWSKLAIVSPILTWKNQEAAFSLCRTKTDPQLKALVKSWPRE